MLHAWWSEHPKYAFQMVTNSTSGVDWMVSDFRQATSTPPISNTQALDENMSKMIGPAQLPSLQESYNLSLSSPLQSPIPSLPFIGAQHPLIDSYPPQADLVLNLLLIMDPSLPSFNPPLPPTSSMDSSPLHSDVPFPDVAIGPCIQFTPVHWHILLVSPSHPVHTHSSQCPILSCHHVNTTKTQI